MNFNCEIDLKLSIAILTNIKNQDPQSHNLAKANYKNVSIVACLDAILYNKSFWQILGCLV